MKKVKKSNDKFKVEFSYIELLILEDLLLEDIGRLVLIEMPSLCEEEILEKISKILNKKSNHDTRNKK